MATGDRLAFYKTSVQFTPTGGNATTLKVASISIAENVTTADVTTTEDSGYSFQLATLSSITGTFNMFLRDNQNTEVLARQTGELKWFTNSANNTTGNYILDIQITNINRGEANLQGAIPVAVSFVGQGGWKTGSFGK